jgi:hypothetical protein
MRLPPAHRNSRQSFFYHLLQQVNKIPAAAEYWYLFCWGNMEIWPANDMNNDTPEKKAGNVSGHNRKIKGQYANYFRVGYNAFEFIFDFGQSYTGTDQAELYMRIITNPFHAKSLLSTLRESIDRYEQVFGDIGWE